MKGLPSIGHRLARAVLASALLWSLAVSAAVWLAVQREMQELLDETLRAAADVMAPALASAPAPADSARGEAAGAATPAEPEAFVWQVVGPGPRVLQASAGAPVGPLLATPSAGLHTTGDWRVYGLALGAHGRMLYVAQSSRERREAAIEVAFSAALATLAVALLAHLWLRARAARELAPLATLSERLAGHDLLAQGATLGPAERRELLPVHQAIDTLAAQLWRRVANERAFAAHAAHALRTPLAGIDAQLAVVLRDCPPALQPRLQQVRAAAGRLQRVVAALLALFRSGVDVHRQPVALDTLLARLPVQGLALALPAPVMLDADPDLLSAALLNLLDNALRHGATRVDLSCPAPGVLRLHDDGPGVDAERREALQAALDAQAYEGRTGLGLMLADMVARAHDGRLRLPPSQAGFAVDLDLRPPPHIAQAASA